MKKKSWYVRDYGRRLWKHLNSCKILKLEMTLAAILSIPLFLDTSKWIPKRLRKPYSQVIPELKLEPRSSWTLVCDSYLTPISWRAHLVKSTLSWPTPKCFPKFLHLHLPTTLWYGQGQGYHSDFTEEETGMKGLSPVSHGLQRQDMKCNFYYITVDHAA